MVDEETGEEKKRLINRMRWKGYGPISVAYADKNVGVELIMPQPIDAMALQIPDKASATVEEQRNLADKKILTRLEEAGFMALTALDIPNPFLCRAALPRTSSMDAGSNLQPIRTHGSARYHHVRCLDYNKVGA